MVEEKRWWFGEGWDGNENFGDQIEIPLGASCIECGEKITERARGILTPCSPQWKTFKLVDGGYQYTVCVYHRSCWFSIVENGVIEGTPVEERMNGADAEWVGDSYPQGENEIPEDPEDLPATEEAEAGKGWKR